MVLGIPGTGGSNPYNDVWDYLKGLRSDMQAQANSIHGAVLKISPLGMVGLDTSVLNLSNNLQTDYMNLLNMDNVIRGDITGVGSQIRGLANEYVAQTREIIGAVDKAFLAVDDTVGEVARSAANQAVAGVGDAIMASGIIPFFEEQTSQILNEIVATGMADQLGLEQKFTDWASQIESHQLSNLKMVAEALTSDVSRQLQESALAHMSNNLAITQQVAEAAAEKAAAQSDRLLTAVESRINVLGESLSSEMAFLNKSVLSSLTENELVGEALGYGAEGLGYAQQGAGMVLSAGEQALQKLEGLATSLTKYLPLVLMGLVAFMMVRK